MTPARPTSSWTRCGRTGWIWNLAGLLNDGVLHAGYVARPEEPIGPYESDVLALESGAPSEPPEDSGLEPVLTLSPPSLRLRKERKIAIRSARGERRVAIVEVVSPGNKDSERRCEHFQTKIVDSIESGLHVVMLDLLPPTGACPPLAVAIARRLGSSLEPSLRERYAASFEVSLEPPRVRLYARELQVGSPLPEDVPLFLEPGRRISLPLEASYRATVERLPEIDRRLLG